MRKEQMGIVHGAFYKKNTRPDTKSLFEVSLEEKIRVFDYEETADGKILFRPVQVHSSN